MSPDGPIADTCYMLHPSIMATHTFTHAPGLDIFLVPSDISVDAAQAHNTLVEDFIRRGLDYLLSVCIGAILLSRSGVLEGRRATLNSDAWAGVT
ncbi:hypothetical protein QBC43DRAFT_202789 [Cladorrhinum sp. PSN259]|nr:hypothetical protein QBC43DRAFT_202789 [Cladorrhinum sp. PSN259]